MMTISLSTCNDFTMLIRRCDEIQILSFVVQRYAGLTGHLFVNNARGRCLAMKCH